MDPDPVSLTLKMPTKNLFFLVFLLITFWRYIYIIFQRLKDKKSHKAVGIVVLLFFLGDRRIWSRNRIRIHTSDKWMDPGGLKIYGSGTLVKGLPRYVSTLNGMAKADDHFEADVDSKHSIKYSPTLYCTNEQFNFPAPSVRYRTVLHLSCVLPLLRSGSIIWNAEGFFF
jgi:hypothetical protein